MTQQGGAHLQVQLNFNALHLGYANRIGLILERAAYTMTAVVGAKENTGLVPNVGLQALGIQLVPRPVEEVRTESTAWVVGCAIRDFLEETYAFLERVREMCAAITLMEKGPVPSEEWMDVVVKPASKFDRLPLGDKLDKLKTLFGNVLDGRSAHLESLNAARNCLVHRLGVVGERDLDGNALEVTWQGTELWVRPVDGSPEFQIVDGRQVVEAGGEVMLRFVVRKRTFALGQRVVLTNADLCEVWMTLYWFGVHTAHLVCEFAKTKGLVVDEPPDQKLALKIPTG